MMYQILDLEQSEEAEEEGANMDELAQRSEKCVVIKTSTRQVRGKRRLWAVCDVVSCRLYFCPWWAWWILNH